MTTRFDIEIFSCYITLAKGKWTLYSYSDPKGLNLIVLRAKLLLLQILTLMMYKLNLLDIGHNWLWSMVVYYLIRLIYWTNFYLFELGWELWWIHFFPLAVLSFFVLLHYGRHLNYFTWISIIFVISIACSYLRKFKIWSLNHHFYF